MKENFQRVNTFERHCVKRPALNPAIDFPWNIFPIVVIVPCLKHNCYFQRPLSLLLVASVRPGWKIYSDLYKYCFSVLISDLMWTQLKFAEVLGVLVL